MWHSQIYQQSLCFQDSFPQLPTTAAAQKAEWAGMLENRTGDPFYIISSPRHSAHVNNTLGRGGKLFCVLPPRDQPSTSLHSYLYLV